LETRTLLAATAQTFTGPSLTDLKVLAYQGVDTAGAAIRRMLTALETQLTNGPLADLKAGTDGNDFVREVQSLEASYVQNVDQQLLPNFPNVDTLLKLQGQRIVLDETSLNEQNSVGLTSDSTFESQAATAINSLTAGPLHSLHTPISGYVTATQAFESGLKAIAASLATSASPSLTSAQASSAMQAATVAYQADIHAALQVTHPGISNIVDTAVSSLLSTATSIASATSSDAESAINSAITAFDNAILDTTGLFGPRGPINVRLASGHLIPPHLTDHRPDTVITDVSGTASFGGTADLSATLENASGTPISGETVSFTLDGAFAGIAVTNSSGVATVSDVPTSDGVGTDSGGVVVHFLGDINYKNSGGSGDLTVSKADTTLSAVSGTATFGGKATLTATLTSDVTSAGISGETVDFTLDGTSVGSAMTDSSGVATLTGVTTTDDAGTHTDAVVASFAGDADYNAATNASGDLVVSKANTTLSAASGTATFGGTATLVATLTSSVTSAGISGETVNFTLDGTSVGHATTNGSGVATLTGVATTDNAGTHTGAVVASFAGDSNYNAATNATGNLVVSKANTTLGSVSGTATFGGTATLVATLTSAVTNAGISGETVNFTLDGTAVGHATTNSNGVASLPNIATTDSAGTHNNVVVASFAGDSNYNAATNGTGNLVVSKANTTLGSVSGTATFGGTATLVATLTSAVTSAGIANEPVTFTLDGVSAGPAVMTNSMGVATLTGVPTTDSAGTHTGVVVASFAGDSNYNAAPNGTGDLVVSKANTALGAVSGTASFGGTATLTATLTSSVTGAPIVNEPVTFTLDGVSAGPAAVTNSMGVATLTGVPTTDDAGTHTGVVVASFAGDSNFNAAPNGTGDLVVSKANTTLGSVSGTAQFGGTATLTATLTSSVTNAGVVGETVVFELDGVPAGGGVTNSMGVATTSVATTDPVGTHPGAVLAIFTGDSNYNSAPDGTGDLTVTAAPTSLTMVSGTATGGMATLTATLTSTVTGMPISGVILNFTLDGTAVGPQMTNSMGVATLMGVPTSDPTGTYPNAVVVAWIGNTDYAPSNASGTLTVS
jgi:hypothetical protein